MAPLRFLQLLGKCSEWLPVAERIITPTYHLVCLCGLGKPCQPGQAWYCWQKWGSASTWATALPFRLKTFQDSWESPWICETSYLQECAIETMNNSDLLKILSLRIIYLGSSSFCPRVLSPCFNKPSLCTKHIYAHTHTPKPIRFVRLIRNSGPSRVWYFISSFLLRETINLLI